MGRELTYPSERLTAAAQLAAAVVFEGENGTGLSAIDVGCDHAKLAIYLIQSGICKSVLACDINDGPVNKARENVSRRKFMDEPLDKYIKVLKNDGLTGLENVDADRVFILGMGGELIANILESAAYTRDVNRKTAYVLQAMTSEYDLRKYLYENGYNIVKEQLVRDKERIYSLILSYYDGEKREKDEVSLVLGESNIVDRTELFEEYLERKIRIQNSLVMQLEKAGVDFEAHKELLEKLQEIKK